MVDSGEFKIGGIDLSDLARIENFREQSRELLLDFSLEGTGANSAEVDLETQAAQAGNVVRLNPNGAAPIWVDLGGTGSPNVVEIRIGEDFIFNTNTPYNVNGIWLDYRVAHELGVTNAVRIATRFGVVEEL